MRRCLIFLAFAASSLFAAVPAVRELNVGVFTRDNVRLSANVFRPAAPGRYPTILLRTPYKKDADLTPNFQVFVSHGYAIVVQDVRGRYQSLGKFEPVNQEINDGDDTLNWIARQAWSDGNVGMYGGSYLGIAQWKAAMSNNPHLKAIFPYVSGDDDYRDRFYSTGGAMKFGHRLLWVNENLRKPAYQPLAFSKFIWTLPPRRADKPATGNTIPIWQVAADHPTYDKFWKTASVREHLKDIRVPVYSVGGWYDNYVESDLDAFQTLSKLNREVRIMIGPWPHTFNIPFPDVSFGKEAAVPLRSEQLAWFDHYLKGIETSKPEHRVRIFVMGINQWRDEDEWPLARARRTKMYLAGNGVLAAAAMDSTVQSAPDAYVYDPRNPAPTMGGAVCCDAVIFPWGPMDQRKVEARGDVLKYTGPVLASDLEVTGAVKAVLYISSTAVDTDFTAKLVDVFPNGEARNLTDGILRVRYRESLDTPRLMSPGKIYKITVDAGVTSNVFRAGHRIRIEISSSNFPRFDRNPNTGTLIADEKDLRKATQRIFHDREHRSYIQLPVIPANPAQLTSTGPTRYVTKRNLPVAR